MADNHAQPAGRNHLTLWEKIKAGVKGAISYIPRGILFIGGMMGASYLAGQAFGPDTFDVLGVAKATKESIAGLAPKFLVSLGLGAGITGIATAVQETTARNKDIEMEQRAGAARDRQIPLRERQVSHTTPERPNVPMGKPHNTPGINI